MMWNRHCKVHTRVVVNTTKRPNTIFFFFSRQYNTIFLSSPRSEKSFASDQQLIQCSKFFQKQKKDLNLTNNSYNIFKFFTKQKMICICFTPKHTKTPYCLVWKREKKSFIFATPNKKRIHLFYFKQRNASALVDFSTRICQELSWRTQIQILEVQQVCVLS